MSAEAQSFLNEMQSEVFERSSGSDGSVHDLVRECIHGEYVMELLAGEVGIVESPEACHLPEERSTEDRGQDQRYRDRRERRRTTRRSTLFISVYKGFGGKTVPAAEMAARARPSCFLGGSAGYALRKARSFTTAVSDGQYGSTRSGRVEAREALSF